MDKKEHYRRSNNYSKKPSGKRNYITRRNIKK